MPRDMPLRFVDVRHRRCVPVRAGPALVQASLQMHTISAPDCVQNNVFLCCTDVADKALGAHRNHTMGKLTTHVLNIADGIPAQGMRLQLLADQPGAECVLADVHTNSDGRCAAPLLQDTALVPGRYRLRFYVADYYRQRRVEIGAIPFLDVVEVAFGIQDATQGYHVPLLVSPWSYSTYRGS